MLEAVVFALEMFIRVMTECSERQLRAMGHVLANQTLETAQYFMVRGRLVAVVHDADTRFQRSNARYKLATHLLYVILLYMCIYVSDWQISNPKINRPADAAKHLKMQIDADIPRPKGEKAWTFNPYELMLSLCEQYLTCVAEFCTICTQRHCTLRDSMRR